MPSNPSPLNNKLLAAMTGEVQARLFPHLELTDLPLGTVVYDVGSVLSAAYFPADCIISLLYCMNNGPTGEIAIVGNEGVVGISLFMGGLSTSSRAIVQSAGTAYQLPATILLEEFERHGDMMSFMLRYAQSLITQMTQTAACNRHHSVDEQLARWLLLSLDRLSGNSMTMTTQLIANMLNVSVARVAEVASRLERLGVISYSNGRIKVVDRPTLEKLSCECYRVCKVETDRLLPAKSAALPRKKRVPVAATSRHDA